MMAPVQRRPFAAGTYKPPKPGRIRRKGEWWVIRWGPKVIVIERAMKPYVEGEAA